MSEHMTKTDLEQHTCNEPRCECTLTGTLYPEMAHQYDPVRELPFVTHAPGECKCTNDLRIYERNGKSMLLCSNCC